MYVRRVEAIQPIKVSIKMCSVLFLLRCVKVLLLERKNFLKPYPVLFVTQMAHGTDIVEIICIIKQSDATVCKVLEDEPSKRDDRKNLFVKTFKTDR
ncbi:hypothetical protein V1478_003686 [Vespula squamosa]|uniref:Uncharacterized protein n=1 Tax=Vespula squamosa TaxID=30214 RepID=A0ABD2BMI5_VESSQ